MSFFLFLLVSWQKLEYFSSMNDEIKIESTVLIKEKIKEPGFYRVLLLNDDITTMDFVISILIEVFHKNYKEAEIIMLTIHTQGSGLVGTYTYDIAATRCKKVEMLAQENGFPLKCIMEKE
ncbi:ATP-dependent Clp protease adaptor protein ClpS [Treponema phagedenis F0421]|nr:ATP-dependent Clp protease adaptor protein ClpS [Treponema phagedenis F0421]